MKTQEELWDKEYSLKQTLWGKETKSLPAVMKGKKVLELGVGNGKTLFSILKQNPKSVIAIDISEEAIKRCKETFNTKKVTFKKADARNLPFKKGDFDVVVCYYLLDNLTENERTKVIEEIRKVLKKGGYVLFEDFAVGDFREEGHKNHSTIKSTGLTCHFFSMRELIAIFKDFPSKELIQETSTPITHKPKLLRKIIRGILKN